MWAWVMAAEEVNWSSTNLLQSAQSVTRGLEALKNEHEVLLSSIKSPLVGESGKIDRLKDKMKELLVLHIKDDIENNEELLLVESKAASLSQSLNSLNTGLNDANVMYNTCILYYINKLLS